MASKLPLPDICTHGHDWSPIAAAPSQSLIAGVIAGFLFAGIVVVLSQRTRRHQDSTRALKLMLTAFLGLVVTSYLYATLAGEETCPRAETEAVLNGGVLGICGIVLIVSLTWLVAAYHTDVKILDFLRGLAYFASLFVVLLLCVSSTGYIDAELPHGSHLVNNILIYVAAGVAIGAAMALIRRRAQPPEAAAGDDATMQDPAADRRDAAVHRCAVWTLGYVAASSVADGVVEAVSAHLWYPPPAWIAYSASWIALAAPLAVLLVVTCALARTDPPPEARSAAVAADEGARVSPPHAAPVAEAGQPVVSQLDRGKIRARQSEYLVEHYLGLHVIVVSVALAMAGVSAASLITRPVSLGASLALLGILWFASLLATAVAYAGTMVGAFALPPTIPAITDLLLPLGLGVVEFLLFSVLIRQVTMRAQLNTIIDAWLILMTIFAMIAAASILRARNLLMTGLSDGVYSEDISESIQDYAARLLADLRGAGLVVVIAALGAGLRLAGNTADWLAFLCSIAIVAVILTGLLAHGRTARMWRRRLPPELPDAAQELASASAVPARFS